MWGAGVFTNNEIHLPNMSYTKECLPLFPTFYHFSPLFDIFSEPYIGIRDSRIENWVVGHKKTPYWVSINFGGKSSSPFPALNPYESLRRGFRSPPNPYLQSSVKIILP